MSNNVVSLADIRRDRETPEEFIRRLTRAAAGLLEDPCGVLPLLRGAIECAEVAAAEHGDDPWLTEVRRLAGTMVAEFERLVM